MDGGNKKPFWNRKRSLLLCAVAVLLLAGAVAVCIAATIMSGSAIADYVKENSAAGATESGGRHKKRYAGRRGRRPLQHTCVSHGA